MSNRKICPLLGFNFRFEPSFLRGGKDSIVTSIIPCIGESCVNYSTDCGDGYCKFFREYIGEAAEERQRATWTTKNGMIFHCSKCGFSTKYKYRYCVCGAKMEVDE